MVCCGVLRCWPHMETPNVSGGGIMVASLPRWHGSDLAVVPGYEGDHRGGLVYAAMMAEFQRLSAATRALLTILFNDCTFLFIT